ncbi:hypothetical protein ACA593_10300 [Lactiplantibacillus pentosus]|uniref:XRE family transcriptional regulator n=1 Tax=Lactiplantibacillus plantarum TaxID=1590 RepID=A0AAX1K7I0_LACPN|nr:MULTISPECIES: hypothetical protein [Lactiplantibacillus]MBJ7524811.1 hypothetical protein [Lactobacillus sp. CRM56-2]AJO74433.1 hypothetical protein SH83_08775 [Lactiplantibacillus plantarum]APP11209.1 hypothetical protein BSG92_01765 [Lactiplantibacillus plantarum subsp. plantarum]AUI79111.1 hypothetical protein BB562_10655 [Lactiplantibacillus pentosus]AYG39375.1 hypothetical protein CFK27_16270 [Lactiplantibacillus pentosus]
MIDIEPGRKAVRKYMTEKSITYRMAGILFGKTPQWIQQVVSGKAKGPEATALIISMINEFGI